MSRAAKWTREYSDLLLDRVPALLAVTSTDDSTADGTFFPRERFRVTGGVDVVVALMAALTTAVALASS